ncbi:unnamed protein product [Discula destructiva]
MSDKSRSVHESEQADSDLRLSGIEGVYDQVDGSGDNVGKSGPRAAARSSPEEWEAFVQQVLDKLKEADYPISAADEQEIRAIVIGRSKGQFLSWMPSSWNPFKHCNLELARIEQFVTSADPETHWKAYPAKRLPPQFPLRCTLLAILGVLEVDISSRPSFSLEKQRLDGLIDKIGLAFLLRGDEPDGFWLDLDMNTDFERRPVWRTAKTNLPRHSRRFMTEQQGLNFRIEQDKSPNKQINPMRTAIYSSPTAQLGPELAEPANSAPSSRPKRLRTADSQASTGSSASHRSPTRKKARVDADP